MPNVFELPEVVDAIESLVEEVDDILQAADPETRRKELAELVSEGVRVGLLVGSAVALATPTVLDDMAIRAVRMLDLSSLIKRALGVPPEPEEGQ